MVRVKGPLASVAVHMGLGRALKGRQHLTVALGRADYARVVAERTKLRAKALRGKNGTNGHGQVIDLEERASAQLERALAELPEGVTLKDAEVPKVETLSNEFLVACLQEARRRIGGLTELRRAVTELEVASGAEG